MVDEFAGGEDLRAFGEELVEQGVMQFEIDVRAAVLDDDEAVVGVSGLEEGGEDDAAGGDAEEDERFDIIGAKDHFKVGACEGADAVLGDDDVVGLRSDRGVDRACGALEEALMAAKRRLRELTSGRLRRKPTCMWMTRSPEARARCRTVAARASNS
jgi:hypothetical protein